MASQYYKLGELIRAIKAYQSPERGGDIRQSFHARIRIGGSGANLGLNQQQKSTAGQAYVVDKLAQGLAQERDPHRQLLYHNVLLRVDFSYRRFLNAARALKAAPLNMVERHASWHTLYVHRFTGMQAFTSSQWIKSGYLLRAMYRPLVDAAQSRYQDMLNTLSAQRQGSAQTPHYVIAVSEFMDENHALAKQAIDLATALTENTGAKVSLLNTSIPPRLPVSYFGDHANAAIVESLNNAKQIHYGRDTFDFAQNQNMILNINAFKWYGEQLAALEPTGIISIGPGNVLVDTFSKVVPTLVFPNTGEVPLSAAPIQCTISAQTKREERLTARAGTPVTDVAVIPTAFRLPQIARDLDRSAFGFPKGARIALVVGMRLQTECHAQFLSILDKAATTHDDLHVVFAGPLHKSRTWLEAYPALSAKSNLLGYQEDVFAITKACDIYINPFRQGGGTSAIFAISAGLPVLTRAQGDVADILGNEECAESQDDFEALLHETLKRGDTLDRLSAHSKKRWAIKSDMSAMTRAIAQLLDGEMVAPQAVTVQAA